MTCSATGSSLIRSVTMSFLLVALLWIEWKRSLKELPMSGMRRETKEKKVQSQCALLTEDAQ